MSQVKISVIIPFLNPGEKLKKAIDSVFECNPDGVELIAWNDGSEDDFNYKVWCSSYSQVVYKKEKNQGVAEARNQATKLAKGEYLLFLDADDWLETGAISDFSEITEQFPELDLVFSWSRIHDLKTGQKEEWNKFHQMVFAGKSTAYSNLAGTFLIKKEVFDRVQGYNTNLRFSENLDLIIRILLLGRLNIQYLKKVTVNFGNSLEGVTRNGKFSQKVLLPSLQEFYSSNTLFFKENSGFGENIICRIIVASVFLKQKDISKTYLAKLKQLGSSRYSKFFWLSRISPVYRFYLSYKGFRA